ncbi:MAG: riboflavin synthase [Methylophilaceae bacterium 17-44-8]|jgi:riboflavin synthase|nr:MAG: riboflavin synthase [Methylophilales bacterium 28-44-11]OYZ07629.1 MAG: riboflavin synthase [Methylophilales bacterium 16-45-7]OZA06075.1 MAG: riboflavin synthase [Methylophilaceae bacterium 17-44-8]
MFTGIIQSVGNIDEVISVGEDIKLKIDATQLGLDDVAIGDSIAVNGVCLTATTIHPPYFFAHVSKATLDVTTGLSKPQPVNLEKAMRLSDRLGGHLVSGHVDGIGKVTQFKAVGDCWLLAVQAPHAISKYIAQKGSICVNGVSLTVNSVVQDTFTVNLIPHTIAHTTLQFLNIQDAVNLEIDQIARYVERMAEWSIQQAEST